MRDKKVLPPTYLLIAIVLMLAFHLLIPAYKIVPIPWNILGIVPLACGIALNLIADRAFHRAQTTVKPFEESSALITTGVFRFGRIVLLDHSAAQSLGVISLVLAGVCLIWGEVSLGRSFRMAPPESVQSLVTHGIYRFTRNSCVCDLLLAGRTPLTQVVF